ncbi:hypothetical protein LKV13_02805 [Borrelia sp. BU AG58]|uniref:hypothetical protein n=1 Tax=Borrelia sp. BU AG58 TaxID=2887345 RepID=UPI001E4DBFFD|nr:hypothetical protein [Borrelia sp. BU AG58]UER67716.1 hypothetical protein LKV13_02805 [Borrelia sp. BU AG58]
MDKGSKRFFVLLKVFSSFSCTSLFGETLNDANDAVISPSAVYIPREDLSEDFRDDNAETPEEDVSEKPDFESERSNKLEFGDLEQLQRLDKSRSTDGSFSGKELQYPQYLRPKKSSFGSQSMHESRFITNINELRLRIESYENKMENIERLLNNRNIETIQKKNEEYEALAKSLKQEIEEIKKLINKRGLLLGNASNEQEDTHGEDDHIQHENTPDQNYDYPTEEFEYYKREPQRFSSEAQAVREIENRVAYNEDAITNSSNVLKEIDNRVAYNEDAIANNSSMLREIDNRVAYNEDAIANNSSMLREIDNRVAYNEDALFTLQKELINLQKNNNENNSLEDIELNLSSVEKIINELRERIEQTEDSYKKNENEINKKQDKMNALEKRLEENESAISTLKKELSDSQKRDLLTKEHKEVKDKQKDESLETHPLITRKKQESMATNITEQPLEKTKVEELTHTNTEKTTGIKPANFQIYPDAYSNNYSFKEKGSNFAFRKPNKYYVEIEPTKSLHRAREIYKLISKHHIKNYFINPSLKHKEPFFRNLIEIESKNEIDSLYRNLESEFKDIRVIK